MIPTLVAGLIGLIILARNKPKAAPVPVRIDNRQVRGRRYR